MKLTNVEMNVLAVALDHMEEHLLDLQVELSDVPHENLVTRRLEACRNLQTKLL